MFDSSELHRWNVPKTGAAGGFFCIATIGNGLAWYVADIDDDGRLELVHTMDPATSTVWDATGTPYWKVFRSEP